MVLGGVPIGVPIPPMFAATGIASESPILPLSSDGRVPRTGARKASIIAAVAVLDMNIEKMEITIRKPSRTMRGLVPKMDSRARPMVTSSPYFSAMMASTKPPMNSITTGSAKEAMILLKLTSWPNFGSQKKPRPLSDTVKREITITSRDVVQFGIISKIHISAAKTKSAMTRCWTTVSSSIPKNDTGTAQRKIVTSSTMGRNTQNLRFSFLVAILYYFSNSKRMSAGMPSRRMFLRSPLNTRESFPYCSSRAAAPSRSPVA